MPDLHLIRDLLPRFSEASLLCVGDVMIDHFVYGQVKRVSPEAPVPVLRTLRQSTVLGGAGNVARNLSSLSIKNCIFCSVVGDDDAAKDVETLFEKIDGVQAFLTTEKGRKTTAKTRYVSDGQQLLRVDDEDSYEISQESEQALLEKVRDLITKIDVMILSDYGKGVLTKSLSQGLIRIAKEHGKIVVVDPKKKDFSAYCGATLITPNAKELQEVAPFPVTSDDDVERATSALMSEYNIEAILATRGSQGMSLNDRHKMIHIPTEALEIYDVSGAGDTVVATAAASLAAGSDLETAAKLSNIAAGLVVSKAGTATVTLEEVRSSLEKVRVKTASDKIVLWEEAKEQVIEWHRRGLKVGFANGCYDLLHPGHISLLSQAKGSCDRLIVALNTDASVQRLKGPSRPLQTESARSHVMAALEDVDLVVLFDEDTPLELIQHLRPDVLIKGADYKVEDVIGSKEVFSWGGDVVLAELQEGHSTTNTISKMAS